MCEEGKEGKFDRNGVNVMANVREGLLNVTAKVWKKPIQINGWYIQ